MSVMLRNAMSMRHWMQDIFRKGRWFINLRKSLRGFMIRNMELPVIVERLPCMFA